MTADGLNFLIAAAIVCCGAINGVTGVPIDFEHNETPFPLELQPPLIDNLQDAVDSYGNPIKFSQPIETPDGRKVISAQGVQFEIPNYASGITEIKKPLDSLLPPVTDPIAVALPNEANSNLESDVATPQQYTLPTWLADFNDPDVGPGVPYVPTNDANALKILSWDLVPPLQQDPETSASHSSVDEKKNFHISLSPGQSFTINREAPATTSRTTSTYYRPITTTSTTHRPTTTTTTTRRPTTTTTTTTHRPTTTTTTTHRPITTTTTRSPITTRASGSKTDVLLTLPGGNSQFLPSWLEGYDDPELNVALPFEVPADNNEYNHTLSTDLLPPLEPFEDLKILHIPVFAGKEQSLTQAPSVAHKSVSTTYTIPTTIRTTTARPHPSTPSPYKFASKQTVTPPTTATQKPSFFTAPTAPTSTTTEQAILNSISQITLKSAAQPTGFKSNTFQIPHPTVAGKVKPTVPPIPVLNFKNNPFLLSKFGQSPFSTLPTTTTTRAPSTTTRKVFHFDSPTVPAWLSGVKNSETRPGIPFTLAGSSKSGVTIQKSISSELSPLLTTNHNSILSQSIPTTQPFTATTLQESSLLFTPPAELASDVNDNTNAESQTNSISVNNLLATTEPTTKVPSKVTFNKVNEGNLISNSIFPLKHTQPAAPNGFTTVTSAPSAFNKPSTPPALFTGKYTGGFGGAPGTLGGQSSPGYAIQPDGSIVDPDYTVRPPVKVTVAPVSVPIVKPLTDSSALLNHQKPTVVAQTPKRAYTGTFGGPPGVLLPYDNAKPGQ